MTTPTSRIQTIVARYRADLLAHEAQAEATLNAAHTQTLATIQPKLDKLYEEIATKIEAGETIPANWVYERLRLENLQLFIQQQIDSYSMVALQYTRTQQHLGVQLGLGSAKSLLSQIMPDELRALLRNYVPSIRATFGVPSEEAIAHLIGATQAGSPLADLFAGWGNVAANGVRQALATGVILGNNPRVVAQSVQRVMEERAGIALNDSRNRALVISRTELNRAYRHASLASYRANSDVVTKYRRTCAKSVRTCAACLALDGTLYDLDTDFAIHPCDRCAAIPVTKSWTELLAPYGIDASKIPDTRPQMETGADWFARQSEATQRTILGDKAYNLYSDPSNTITLQDFVTRKHDKDWGSSIQVTPLKELVKKWTF